MRIRDLNALFGDGRALEEVKRLALDDSASLDVRKAALKTLIEARPPDLRSICERLVRVRFLNAVAVRGLALFDDPAIGKTLAGVTARFTRRSGPCCSRSWPRDRRSLGPCSTRSPPARSRART